jgi:alpha-glucosidase
MADQDRPSKNSSPWWRGATFYQVYVRSWRDSNGDGTGDLAGILDGLDYLESLSVDGIWLSPTMPSPNTDWGYDVSDYYGVHPDLGSTDDLERLVKEAASRGISVLLDLVPNHTSSAHPWFVDALSGPSAKHRDWYVWAPPKAGNAPPNNWISATGAPAWTFDAPSGQYYLHNFLPTQPDLNWWNPAVPAEFESVLRYWWDRGVAGFRIDVAHGLYKDRQLRDNPPATPDDPPESLRDGLRTVYNSHRPEVHEIYRRWRKIADGYQPGRVLLGETWEFDYERLGDYYGRDEPELHLCFNFPFVFSHFSARDIAGVVEATLAGLPAGATPTWTASNHDVGRFPSRWCNNDPRAVKAALLVMATLPGTMVLYYGDELGMTDVDIPRHLQLDEISLARPGVPGRDRCRTPMPWTGGKDGGFTTPSARPWLPLGEHRSLNVQAEHADPTSVLNFWRRLGALRRSGQIGMPGQLETLLLDDQCWAYRSGETITVANLSPEHAEVELPRGAGKVLASSTLGQEGNEADSRLSLGPWQALVAVGAWPAP